MKFIAISEELHKKIKNIWGEDYLVEEFLFEQCFDLDKKEYTKTIEEELKNNSATILSEEPQLPKIQKIFRRRCQ